MGIIVDSSILVAFERRRFDLERLLVDHAPSAIATITAAELLIGVERADSADRRAKRNTFVESILARMPMIPFELAQARLYAQHWAELVGRGEAIGDRDLQIAATALSIGYDLATLNNKEFSRVTRLNVLDVTAYITGR